MKASWPQPVTDEQRHANDVHVHWVPLVVLGFLLAVSYVWTDWMVEYPLPGLEVAVNDPVLSKAFNRDGHLSNSVWMHSSSARYSDSQVRVLLGLSALGFLFAYYLPISWKRPPLVILTAVGLWWALGPAPLAFFLGWHALAYLVFHQPTPVSRSAQGALTVLVACLWSYVYVVTQISAAAAVLGAVLAMLTADLLYRYLLYGLLKGALGRVLQPLVANAALIYIAVAVLVNAEAGEPIIPSPVGCLLFFWQWERVLMYYIDLKDHRTPPALQLRDYLATFLTPATLSNFHWLSRIPLGYEYLNRSFYARDKNRVVLSGVWLVLLSVAFFALRPVGLELFMRGVEALGIEPIRYYSTLVDRLAGGHVLSAAAIWCTLIYAFLNFYWLWTAVAHLKVGLWRLFGYDIEPYFQKPFLATNLVQFWRRYSYYYREFLVRAFYYPVFLRFFRNQPYVRVFVATFAAAGLGNLIYHVYWAALFHGATPELVGSRLATFPYYVLIGASIAATQVYLLRRRRRRRPWTRGWRIAVDSLAMVGTIGLFVLIRPFHHVPKDDSIADAGRIVLAAFGL